MQGTFDLCLIFLAATRAGISEFLCLTWPYRVDWAISLENKCTHHAGYLWLRSFLAATRAGKELISMPNMTIQSWLGYKLGKQINTPCRAPLT